MITAVAVTVDGILRKPIGGQLVDAGKRLYDCLRERYNVVLLSDDTDPGPLETWLREHRISGYGKLCTRTKATLGATAAQARCHQVNSLTMANYAVDLIYDPDPEVAAQLVERGYNTALFISAALADPSWRPTYSGLVTPWDEIVKQVAVNNQLWASKELAESE